MATFRFTAGPWNIHEGNETFGPGHRKSIPLEEKMKKYAEILSEGLPEARIDFYDINGKVYFGEITFFHWSGFEKFNPHEWDEKFGSWITLPIN